MHTNTYSKPKGCNVRGSIAFQYGIPEEASLGMEEFILLGGMFDISRNDPAGFNANSAFDRVTTTIELLKQKKAPVLAIGGQTKEVMGEKVKEATVIGDWLKQLNLAPEKGIIELEHSRDTRDEAVHVARAEPGIADPPARNGAHRGTLPRTEP